MLSRSSSLSLLYRDLTQTLDNQLTSKFRTKKTPTSSSMELHNLSLEKYKVPLTHLKYFYNSFSRSGCKDVTVASLCLSTRQCMCPNQPFILQSLNCSSGYTETTLVTIPLARFSQTASKALQNLNQIIPARIEGHVQIKQSYKTQSM